MNNIFYLLFHHLFHFHTVHYVRRGYFVQFTYTVSDPGGKLRGQINVISYVLNSISSQKTCSFSCNEACPSPPPPILSQVNLNLALLDLYSIPSDFCIILE